MMPHASHASRLCHSGGKPQKAPKAALLAGKREVQGSSPSPPGSGTFRRARWLAAFLLAVFVGAASILPGDSRADERPWNVLFIATDDLNNYSDPDELVNLAGDPAHADTASALRDRLHEIAPPPPQSPD